MVDLSSWSRVWRRWDRDPYSSGQGRSRYRQVAFCVLWKQGMNITEGQMGAMWGLEAF